MQPAGAISGGEEPRIPETPEGRDEAVPARIGKYEVRSELGNGTLVKLFRASDRDTGRPVILKVLTGSRDRRLVELFRRVVGNAARLRHRICRAAFAARPRVSRLYRGGCRQLCPEE